MTRRAPTVSHAVTCSHVGFVNLSLNHHPLPAQRRHGLPALCPAPHSPALAHPPPEPTILRATSRHAHHLWWARGVVARGMVGTAGANDMHPTHTAQGQTGRTGRTRVRMRGQRRRENDSEPEGDLPATKCIPPALHLLSRPLTSMPIAHAHAPPLPCPTPPPTAAFASTRQNLGDYLSGKLYLKGESGAKKISKQMPLSSSLSLPSSLPPTSAPSRASTSTHHGLVILPFPKQERRKDSLMRISNIAMNETGG